MQIDRIEGNLAIIELDNGTFIEVPVSHIEGRVRDGACVKKTTLPNHFQVDEASTQDIRTRIEAKMRDLFI